jgi:DNA-binding transcriptional MerR regulator
VTRDIRLQDVAADDLLSIGSFAALTGLSIHTLRHYDDIGLLRPVWVDPRTGYRWYEPRQARRAGLVRRLRAVDVPLDEVAELVTANDVERVRSLLDAHADRLDQRAAALAADQDVFASLSKEIITMSQTDQTTPLLGPIGAVRLFTSDLGAARAFYRDALELRELTATPEWITFDTGDGQRLILEPGSGDLVGRYAAISFTVGDAVAVCAELERRGVRITRQPEQQEWGGTLADIADPDGNILTLAQYASGGDDR